ncbi:MAG: AbrB/MazE/SpoVT family DNA-binding domain-containing protein [Thaumarchaeota archaeon]|nr:AbrB/MazE/SpoVT family DNA-binding domain-containing protein [Nitrososphaerota archaeon]MCL5316679.1 AbrB/MazE/SpoVT family DNA-binding domain-containing protein [Nitrososphaerota archaeon]
MSDILMETTRLSEKGQVVIPKDFREKMGLKPGSRFLVIATEDSIILQRIEVVKQKMAVDDILSKARNLAEGLSGDNT